LGETAAAVACVRYPLGAKALDISVPATLLARADDVIE
jgi:hypothetical protein